MWLGLNCLYANVPPKLSSIWTLRRSKPINNVGEVLLARGDLAGALKSYRDGLAIRERLAQSDPGNAAWQRGLSVSYERVGDVQVARGASRIRKMAKSTPPALVIYAPTIADAGT
jgi:hypothetical protein